MGCGRGAGWGEIEGTQNQVVIGYSLLIFGLKELKKQLFFNIKIFLIQQQFTNRFI
jgi:hypothetical protein